MPSVRSIMSCLMLAGSGLLPANAVDHGGDFALSEPVKGERGDVRSSEPWRLKFRADTSRSAARATCLYPVHGHDRALPSSWGRSNERPRRSSAPGFVATAPPFVQSVLPAFSAGVAAGPDRAWDSVRRSGATASRQRGGDLGRGRALRQQRIELVELRFGSIVVRKSRRTLHLADDRIKRAVGMLRRTEIAQARVWFGSEAFQ